MRDLGLSRARSFILPRVEDEDLHIGEWMIRHVEHRKSMRRAPAKLLSPQVNRHSGACWASSLVLSPHIKETLMVSAYEKRLSRGLVLRMRRHRNGGIINDAVEKILHFGRATNIHRSSCIGGDVDIGGLCQQSRHFSHVCCCLALLSDPALKLVD